MVDTEKIVNLLWAIHADADGDAMCGAGLNPGVVEQGSVGLHVEFYGGDALQNATGTDAPRIEFLGSDQARLAAVKHEICVALSREEAIPTNSFQRCFENLIRHESGFVLPRRIGLIVDVTIRAIEIAAGCNLYDVLIDICDCLQSGLSMALKQLLLL